MNSYTRHFLRSNLFLIIAFGMFNYANGQDMVNVLVKVYDLELNPYPTIGIVLDDATSFKTDEKGIAFVVVPETSLPPTAIDISDRKLEAESWNYSKGTLEIIIREKNYRHLQIKIADKNNVALSGIKVHVSSTIPTTLTSGTQGQISLILPNNIDINNPDLFHIEGYTIIKRSFNDENGIILIEEIIRPTTQTMEDDKNEKADVKVQVQSSDQDAKDGEELLFDIGLQDLDSITSLTVLYALIKKVNYEGLDSLPKNMLDDKFNELMQVNDLSSIGLKSPLSLISDSSFINRDVMLIIDKIKNEKELLIHNQEEFEKATEQLNLKLKDGGQNLSAGEQEKLIQLVLDLKDILKDNEDLFYKNNIYYKKQVESLQSQIVNVFELEDLLFKSEVLGRNFKQILAITFVAFLGLAIITFFFKYVIRTLKEHKNKLDRANSEIEKMNANLEDMVSEKTVSLELINNELETFLYHSSHNLRRPLTSIRGLTNIAKFTPNGEANLLFENIELTAKAMEKMVDKLTTMSHINQPVNFGDIDIAEIIEDLKLKFAVQIEALNIAFSISFQPGVQFRSYPLVMEVILYNIFENAIFFCQFNNRNVPRIEISTKLDENRNLYLSVRDNGCGIQPDILGKIWDMFYIGNEMSKGDGLGLYITKKAIGSLHGTIDVNTEEDKFCEFNIVLPYLKP